MSDALTEAVQRFVQDRVPVRIQGGGTKSFLGHVDPALPVLDTSLHTGVISYEPTELILRVRAGTTIAEIDELLADEGQMLGFEPPAFDGRATIGGTIAAGMAGQRRPFAGAARDFVLGVGLITNTAQGAAKYLEFGGQVMKNVAGFDVSRLMAGAFGCLGVIADVSLKVLPKPALEVTLMRDVARNDAHELMLQLGNQSAPITAICYVDHTLYVRLSGSEEAVSSGRDLRLLSGFVESRTTLLDEISHYRLPHVRDDAEVWRISVAPGSDMFLEHCSVMDWGGARRFLVDPDFVPHNRISHGHATCIRGDVSQPFAEPPLPVRKIHERLKQALDPSAVFNPGRLYAWM